MTIKELSNKFADKNSRILETTEKIKTVKTEIVDLNDQELVSIQNEKPESVMKLIQKRRAKEDELQILYRVRDCINASPVIAQCEIDEVWSGICTDIMSEFENAVLPELKEAYERFCQAVEAIVTLRQKAHKLACQLKKIAEEEFIQVRINNPFSGLNLAEYYPNKIVLAKLNCINGLLPDITKPISFNNLS